MEVSKHRDLTAEFCGFPGPKSGTWGTHFRAIPPLAQEQGRAKDGAAKFIGTKTKTTKIPY
jgi:hypothetical protein